VQLANSLLLTAMMAVLVWLCWRRSWSLTPDYKIFMDWRIEIYSDQVWGDYSAVTRGRADWQQVLDGYRVDRLLLDTAGGYHADLLPQVQRSPDWERAFESGRVVVFRRR
jgi:hypothetical protein